MFDIQVRCLIARSQTAFTGEATWSGSPRHLRTVSTARSHTVYRWSSSLWKVATPSLLVFIRRRRTTPYDVSKVGQIQVMSQSTIVVLIFSGMRPGIYTEGLTSRRKIFFAYGLVHLIVEGMNSRALLHQLQENSTEPIPFQKHIFYVSSRLR